MLLSEFFEHLVSGELAQLHMGDIDNLRLDVEDFPKVLPSINLGLTEIYKRFPIRIEELILRQQPEISTYMLTGKYAQTSDSNEPVKYIHDSIYEPFQDNVLKVEQVFNELGMEIPLNEEIAYNQYNDYASSSYQPNRHFTNDYNFQSARTPTFNSVQILPHPLAENNLLIKYRAAHAVIPNTADIIPGEIEIDIPLAMLEPLLLYVGGRVYANMHGEDPNSGAGFIAKFEASCKKIEDLNLFNKGLVVNTKLDRAGWS